MQNPFENAMMQLDKVVKIKSFDKKLIDSLRNPNRDIRIQIPVLMDDGNTKFLKVIACNIIIYEVLIKAVFVFTQ